MKTVYITGCLGFIGSYITYQCIDKGWYVKGVDKITYASNIAALFPNTEDAWVIDSDDDGNSYAVSSSWYTNFSDDVPAASDWLISPEIKLTSGNTLSWRAIAVDADYPDGYVVMMQNITGDSIVLIESIAAEASEWTPHSYNLSAYEGDSVQFYFVNNSTDKFLL